MKLATFGSLALLLVSNAFADEPSVNILADNPALKFKASIVCSDSYADKILTARDPDFGTFREVVAGPQKISAKVVASLAEFDPTEISNTLPIGFAIGDFSYASTLEESLEAQKAGGTFPPTGKKATFPFFTEVETPSGDFVAKNAGSLVFAWAKTKLTVTLKCSDVEGAEQLEIGASNYIGLYVDESDEGTKPSGSLAFTDEAICSVEFGTSTGSRSVVLKGTSSTAYKKFGSENAGTLEEFFLEKVVLKGTTGPVMVP
jgi:hypothetical protein